MGSSYYSPRNTKPVFLLRLSGQKEIIPHSLYLRICFIRSNLFWLTQIITINYRFCIAGAIRKRRPPEKGRLCTSDAGQRGAAAASFQGSVKRTVEAHPLEPVDTGLRGQQLAQAPERQIINHASARQPHGLGEDLLVAR